MGGLLIAVECGVLTGKRARIEKPPSAIIRMKTSSGKTQLLLRLSRLLFVVVMEPMACASRTTELQPSLMCCMVQRTLYGSHI